jgi:plasmid stabilization system protein ParE
VIYRILYTDSARSDLREIAVYFRNAAGDVVAEATVGKIVNKIETSVLGLLGSDRATN